MNLTHLPPGAKAAPSLFAALTLLTAVLLLLAAPAPASAVCAFPASAGNETLLNDAITCFNLQVAPGTYTINLTGDIPLSASTIDLDNATAGVELLLNGGGFIVDGQDIGGVRPFTIAADTTVTFQDITITGGSVDDGGAIASSGTLTLLDSTIDGNNAGINGGGIFSEGTLTLDNSTVSGNTAVLGGGGGIVNLGTATITNTAVTGNGADNAGGILNFLGTTTISTSNVSGNTAVDGSGGILNSQGAMQISDSTIAGNLANYAAGIQTYLGPLDISNSTVSGNLSPTGLGGGVVNNDTLLTIRNSTITGNSSLLGASVYTYEGTTTLDNTILANNAAGGECYNDGGSVNVSHSLIEDDLSCVNGTNTANLTGDPALGPLQDNGGPTLTHALLPNSPAINSGSNALALEVDGSTPLAADQRGAGFTRIVAATVDMGSFESNCGTPASAATLPALNLAVSCFNGLTVPLLYEILIADDFEIITNTVPIDNTTSGTELIIWGNDHTLDALGSSGVRPFTVVAGTTVTIRNIKVTGGNAPDGGGIRSAGDLTLDGVTLSGNSSDYGGGLYNTGDLTLLDSTVSGNTASGNGGGIHNFFPGDLTVRRSEVTGNTATSDGGGIYNYQATASILDSTLAGNTATWGSGGGFNNYNGTLTMSNSTVSGNDALQGAGAGIFAYQSTQLIRSSTIAANDTPYSGGGLYNHVSTTTLQNTILADTTGGNNCFDDGGTIDAVNSLIEDALLCVSGTNTANLTGDPALGPLQANGGPTRTHMPAGGGLADNSGDNTICTAKPVDNLDQRGVTRPQDATCDIGAVEITDQAALSGVVALQGRIAPGTAGTVTVADLAMGSTAVPYDAVTGVFSFPSVPVASGGTNYEVTAAHGLYLANQIASQATAADDDLDLGTTTLSGGDANNDGSINILDLGCMGGAYNTPGSSCGGAGGTDINNDGITNIQDLGIAGGNYNLSAPQGW